jgi:hypothetical protein
MLSTELPQWRSTAGLLAYFSSVADVEDKIWIWVQLACISN